LRPGISRLLLKPEKHFHQAAFGCNIKCPQAQQIAAEAARAIKRPEKRQLKLQQIIYQIALLRPGQLLHAYARFKWAYMGPVAKATKLEEVA
jgi:hypothetical protein